MAEGSPPLVYGFRGSRYPYFVFFSATVFMKTTYYPAIATKRTLKAFATRLRENISPQPPILFYNSFDYGTIFYSRRDVAQYAEKVNGSKSPVFFLMWEEDWERLRKKNVLEMLAISEGRGGRWQGTDLSS